MEDLKVSQDYKRAFNDADMICTHMPHELENIEMPEHEAMEYTQGFEDRIKQYEIEQDAIKNFSYEQLREKYGKDLDDYGKARSKDIEKDKG